MLCIFKIKIYLINLTSSKFNFKNSHQIFVNISSVVAPLYEVLFVVWQQLLHVEVEWFSVFLFFFVNCDVYESDFFRCRRNERVESSGQQSSDCLSLHRLDVFVPVVATSVVRLKYFLFCWFFDIYFWN